MSRTVQSALGSHACAPAPSLLLHRHLQGDIRLSNWQSFVPTLLIVLTSAVRGTVGRQSDAAVLLCWFVRGGRLYCSNAAVRCVRTNSPHARHACRRRSTFHSPWPTFSTKSVQCASSAGWRGRGATHDSRKACLLVRGGGSKAEDPSNCLLLSEQAALHAPHVQKRCLRPGTTPRCPESWGAACASLCTGSSTK